MFNRHFSFFFSLPRNIHNLFNGESSLRTYARMYSTG
nr:MAG TPA: hypothetical protein [Caudoviricetes sp.]